MSPHFVPKYRHYKPKDLGLVVIDGRQIYLGKHNSPESLAEYHRLVQEWLARGKAPALSEEDPLRQPLVSEILVTCLDHREPGVRLCFWFFLKRKSVSAHIPGRKD